MIIIMKLKIKNLNLLHKKFLLYKENEMHYLKVTLHEFIYIYT